MMPCPEQSVWAAWAADALLDNHHLAADPPGADGEGASALATHLGECTECRATLAACEAEEHRFAARMRVGEREVPPPVTARVVSALATRLAAAAHDAVRSTDSTLPLTPADTNGGAMSTAPPRIAHTMETGSAGPRQPAARPHLLAGTTYAELRVEERFESDELADAYIARATASDDPVELVVLDPKVTRDAAVRGAMVDRMRALARVDHPHAQRLRSFGKSKGCYYAAFAYVQGERASERLRSRRPQDYAATIAHLRQLVGGLESLHAAGLAHGRIGPNSVVLASDRATLVRPGLPLVLALESAAWTRLKPVYLAPEVLAGGAPDARADIFAVGCLAYHLLAGTAPYRADTIEEATGRVLAGAAGLRKYNQRVPAEADVAIARMIAPDQAERYADAGELGRALAALPREAPTQVAIDYASALGAAALESPAVPTPPSRRRASTMAPTGDRASTRSRTTSSASGSRPANYQELVAAMNQAAALDDARDRETSSRRARATGRSTGAGLAGRAYRRLEGRTPSGLPPRVLQAAAGMLCCVGLCSGAFYWWSLETQQAKNDQIATMERPGIKEGPVVDPNAGKTTPTAAEVAASISESCRRTYQTVVDELKKMETFDRRKDRERFDKLSRMLLEGCIDKGKKKGLEWPYLADAYNLRGRIEFYWAYTDTFFEVADSVRKDHVGIARRDMATALRLYQAEGAQTQFRLRLHPWMPEHRKSSSFVLDAHKKGIAEGYAEVRVTTAQQAHDDLAHFLASAGLPLRRP